MVLLLALFSVVLVGAAILYRSFSTPAPLYPLIKVRQIETILAKYFPYYQQLPLVQKKTFLKRVMHFMQQKQFVARGFQPVTLEMKAMVAASAVQLT
ncbi:MAG: zinc-dependent peptidase, partial [Tunicatimonas sp.]|uniref:zinc-dependent peptidase n=1 Tax=Tunicatimonas sp. TaxID=1940096 RepID=UPI003C739A8E